MHAHAELLTAIRQSSLTPLPHPRLLVGTGQLPALQDRIARYLDLRDALQMRMQQVMTTPPNHTDPQFHYYRSQTVAEVAQAYAILGDPTMLEWVRRETMTLLDADTWIVPVHRAICPHLDHAAANTAAGVALAYDLCSTAFSDDDHGVVLAGMRRLFFEPFLRATDDDGEWWFRPGNMGNWKIMTCGEAGLAICGFAEYWPEAHEALARAAQGVLDILDAVPAEGDWPEGIGYWFGTLRFGLRFALALRRLTGGTINLFAHPALSRTGDFLAALTTPAGHIYNFNDNEPVFGATLSEVLVVLGAETGRDDWLALARRHPAPTLLFLSADDLTRGDNTPLYPTVASFPTTGVATLRTGTDDDALFVGFKSGPSTVGHSHLDANSFVIEANGQPLIIDEGIWPYAHFIGFFDTSGPRWNFDANASVAHNSLLVDGQGQTFGDEYPGRLLGTETLAPGILRVAGEAGMAYPGLLRQYTRTVLVLAPDAVVIRDVIACDGERHLEWLLHYAGVLADDGLDTVIEHQGVRLRVTPFLPDRGYGWRVSDVTRTSIYECSNTRQEVSRAIRYRSFSPFRAAANVEFLFGLRINTTCQWHFTPGDDWRLALDGHTAVVRSEGDGLGIT